MNRKTWKSSSFGSIKLNQHCLHCVQPKLTCVMVKFIVQSYNPEKKKKASQTVLEFSLNFVLHWMLFWLNHPRRIPALLIHCGPLPQTYLTSTRSNTWALQPAWRRISTRVDSESWPYVQTSHQEGRWQERTLRASKTTGETARSWTTSVSQHPRNGGKSNVTTQVRGPQFWQVLLKNVVIQNLP